MALRFAAETGRGQPAPGFPWPGLGDAIADFGQPVSYTHLRAHETVLDLVCRLLLEKKKHHTNYPTMRRHTHT